MTRYESVRTKTDRAYREWARCRHGLKSTILWLVYKYWHNRLNTMPLYEATKIVKKEN